MSKNKFDIFSRNFPDTDYRTSLAFFDNDEMRIIFDYEDRRQNMFHKRKDCLALIELGRQKNRGVWGGLWTPIPSSTPRPNLQAA